LEEGNPVIPVTTVNGVPQYNVANGSVPFQCQNNALSLDANGNTQPFMFPITSSPNGTPTQTPINPGQTYTSYIGLNAFTGSPYPCRNNPYFTSALFITSPSNSWYNGLQVLAIKRMSHGLDFQASYTYSRAIDTTAGQMFNTDCGTGQVGTAVGFHPSNLLLDKGVSCSDVPHYMRLSMLYRLPTIGSGSSFARLLNGWRIGNIVTLSQGNPFTPLVTQDRSFSGVITQSNSTPPSLNSSAVSAVTIPNSSGFTCGTAHPEVCYNWVPYDPKTVMTGDPNHWFNPLMFGEAPLGTIGNTPRDVLRMPGLTNWDFSLMKDTKLGFLGEQGNLEFRAEFFNLMNHANFGIPNNTVFAGSTSLNSYTPLGGSSASCAGSCPLQAPVGASPSNPLGTAGQITTTSTNSRQIQLALKLIF
jgi:hypothetical protein